MSAAMSEQSEQLKQEMGDVVDTGAATGTVEAVTLRTTKLRDVEGVVERGAGSQVFTCEPRGLRRGAGGKAEGRGEDDILEEFHVSLMY